ncbi:DUF6783 domain-containing protein [Blautia sp.]
MKKKHTSRIFLLCSVKNGKDFQNQIFPILLIGARACLKKAFCKMCVTICGRFFPLSR